jgi:hypothetical protein
VRHQAHKHRLEHISGGMLVKPDAAYDCVDQALVTLHQYFPRGTIATLATGDDHGVA